MDIKLDLFVVINQEGKFFRAKGYGGGGDSWVDDIQKAKIYPKIGQARSRVTWFNNNYPKYGMPNILQLTVTSYIKLDETARVTKAKEAKKIREAKQISEEKKRRLKQAEEDFKEAQKTLNKLKKEIDWRKIS